MHIPKRTAALLQALLVTASFLIGIHFPVYALLPDTVMQTLSAVLYTDETYSEPLLNDTEILLTGEMPENAVVRSYPVPYSAEGMKTLAAYDITVFYEDGQTVFEPEDQSISVTFSMPALLDADPDELAVFHILEDGTEAEVTGISTDGDSVSFDAESFSVYVISEHENSGHPETPRIEFHFLSDEYTENGGGSYTAAPYEFPNRKMELQTSQIVLNSEKLELIKDPPNHEGDSAQNRMYFYGWYAVTPTQVAEDGTVTYTWTDDPLKIDFEKPVTFTADSSCGEITWTQGDHTETLTADADGCAHVYLAPLYSEYYFLNFYDKLPESESDQVSLLHCQLIAFGADASAESRIGNKNATPPDVKHKVFIGWQRVVGGETVKYITVDSDDKEIINPAGCDGYYITCRQDEADADHNINLYPIFAEARWINFDHESGATYVGSKYILTDDEGYGTHFTSFPVSEKVGYDFQGWFTADGTRITDADGNLVSSYTNEDGNWKISGGEISAYRMEGDDTDITLYPRWTQSTSTQYTLNIWMQKSTDTANLDDADKQYDFVESHVLDAASGWTLSQLQNNASFRQYYKSGNNAYQTGFHYGRTEMAVYRETDRIPVEAITSDGQTVVDLYYDRNVHNLYFQIYDYTYSPASGTNGTQYGIYEGQYVPVYYNSNDGQWYRTRTGFWSYSYSDSYDGNRYTRSSRQSWQTIKTITELFQHNIAAEFPIQGDNGVTYNNGERWEPQNSSTFRQVLVRIENMPNEDVTFRLNTANYTTKTMNYYVECLPGETPDRTFEGIPFKLYHSIGANYNYITEAEDFTLIEGYTKYKSNPLFSSGKIQSTPADFYYRRDINTVSFEPNYPENDPNLSFGGHSYHNDSTGAAPYMSSTVSRQAYYEEPLGKFGEEGSEYVDLSDKAPDNYEFGGWYTDQSCTTRFDFDAETMPAGNLAVFAKWVPFEFRVKIDPNGAEIDHIRHTVSDYRTFIFGSDFPEGSEPIPVFRPGSAEKTTQATYFDLSYNETIDEYTLVPPQYIAISDHKAAELGDDQVYYYINMQYESSIDGDGIPSDLRNALYVTGDELEEYYNFYRAVIAAYKQKDPVKYGGIADISYGVWKQQYVSSQKYAPIELVTDGRYSSLGWYEVDEDGKTADMPFDFTHTSMSKDVKLRNLWRLDGGYTIAYLPSCSVDGNIINGDMTQWTDPAGPNTNYAANAETTILRQPDHITANGHSTDEYIFRGWQLVSGGDSLENLQPLEPGVYYQPGEPFVINQLYADQHNTIRFQAVYEKVSDAYRRPETADLRLDANGGYVTERNSDTRITQDDPLAWTQWYDSDAVGTVKRKLDSSAPVSDSDQIWFNFFQSDAALHLYQFATGADYDPGDDKPDPASYFSHGDGYMLLGFDKIRNENDFIADYAADAVISIQRTDSEILYAVWEPTVYLNLKNETDKELVLSLNAEDTETLYVVNEATSAFDRVKVDDLNHIVVPAGQTVRLAVPYGADKNITVSGVNTLGTGQVLKTTSHLPPDDTLRHDPLYTDNGQPFSYTDSLVNDKNGIEIVFEQEKRDYILILDDPAPPVGRDTGEHEFDFEEADLDDPFILDETRASTGYIFKGWANTPGAAVPDYVVNGDTSATLDLQAMFADSYTETGSGGEKIRRLYAVWEIHNEAGSFHIYKEALAPGNPDQEFEFTVDLYAPYRFSGNSASQTPISGTQTFRLKNGEYLDVASDINYGLTDRAYIHLIVTRYDINGEQVGEPVVMGGQAPRNGQIIVQNTEYKVTVTEALYENYDTSMNILAHTGNQGYQVTAESSRALSWTDPNTGGTAMFANERKTVDVTLKKLLEDPENTEPGKRFRFSVELIDTDADYAYTLSDSEIALISGDQHTMTGLPVNATLRITELEPYDHNVTVTAENGSADLDGRDNVFTFRVPDSGETVTYSNALRRTKVVIYSVDENGDPFEDAIYHVSGHPEAVYPDSTGLFYQKDPIYFGSFTITQSWCDDHYQQIEDPITVTIAGTDSPENGGMTVTSDYADTESEYDAETDTWIIRIINREKQVAPTGVSLASSAALAALAGISLLFCTAFVRCNRRRREVDGHEEI